MSGDEWKCAGCGVFSPGRVRSCGCPTSVVYKMGGESAWKIEKSVRFDPAGKFDALIRQHRAALKVGPYVFLGWAATALACSVPLAFICLIMAFAL